MSVSAPASAPARPLDVLVVVDVDRMTVQDYLDAVGDVVDDCPICLGHFIHLPDEECPQVRLTQMGQPSRVKETNRGNVVAHYDSAALGAIFRKATEY